SAAVGRAVRLLPTSLPLAASLAACAPLVYTSDGVARRFGALKGALDHEPAKDLPRLRRGSCCHEQWRGYRSHAARRLGAGRVSAADSLLRIYEEFSRRPRTRPELRTGL